MKKEIFRIQNGMIQQGRILRGPFFLQFCEGEISGIVTDDSFEKEILVNFFRCRNILKSGDFYYLEKRISYEHQYKILKKIVSEKVSVISGNSQLFDSLNVSDNIFIPGKLIKSNKQKKIALELMDFFGIKLPLHIKCKELTLLQRLQIEILHAVALRHKLIIVSDINGKLRSKERDRLNKLYEKLIQLGYSICQIESLNNISLDRLDHVQIIEKGKSVGYFRRPEMDYSEIMCLVNRTVYQDGYTELLRHKNKKLFGDYEGLVLELIDINYKHIMHFSLKLRQRDIIEINCRTGTDYSEIKNILTGKASTAVGQFLYNGRTGSINMLNKAIGRWEIGSVDFINIDNLMFENLSIVENVCYPLCLKVPNFYGHKKYMKAAEDYIKIIMPELDLNTKVKNLTQEQIMRLVLCKWILCKPKMLLLFVSSAFAKDEPDLFMERILVELNKYGIPVLIISERYKFESEIIDEEYIVNNGIIVKKE